MDEWTCATKYREIRRMKNIHIDTYPSITLCACFSVHCGLGRHVSGIPNWWSAQFCPQSSGKLPTVCRLVECMNSTFNRKKHAFLFAFTGIFCDLKRKKDDVDSKPGAYEFFN